MLSSTKSFPLPMETKLHAITGSNRLGLPRRAELELHRHLAPLQRWDRPVRQHDCIAVDALDSGFTGMRCAVRGIGFRHSSFSRASTPFRLASESIRNCDDTTTR